jgi:hypothetical protein
MRASRLLSIALALLCLAGPSRSAGVVCVLIVNSANNSARLSRDQVRDIFIGRTKLWPSGEVAQLVLHDESSEQMEWIGAELFSASGRVVANKLNQEVFKGDLKRPLKVDNDDDAIATVRKIKGGLAVVRADTKLPAGVSAVTLTD